MDRQPPGLRILVVEDHDDSAASLALLLRIWGHAVRVARDGLTALEMARAFWPDVVLLDIRLPGMDGWQVADQLQKQPAPRKPLLIALTGHGRDADRRRSQETGIHLHLLKPVEPDQLRGLLSRLQRILTQPADQTPPPFPTPHSVNGLSNQDRGHDPG
jgi:CheY-like chemotaxis protein